MEGILDLNRNYQAGRRLEYEVRNRFKELGFHVLRSAGSHSVFDLVAFKPTQIVGIQCKLVSDGAEEARLRSKWLSNPPFPPYEFPGSQCLATKIRGRAPIYQWAF